MLPSAIMIQGTTSDAGKSIFATAMCRLLKRRGLSVAPFKPQNMALNSAVTVDGGEIGRAQALQAMACGLEPHTDMNPVLLKPNSEIGTQVIIQGRAVHTMDALTYHHFKPKAMAYVLDSFFRLENITDIIVVEGAGSPAEINLRDRDIANMGFAEQIDCPVLLVADIDRGGVFAHIVGTLDLLSASERDRVFGFIINKFRGDLALLKPGLDWLEKKTGKPVVGVIPFLPDLRLAAEDSFFDVRAGHSTTDHPLRVLVPWLPRISNHTDLDPLRWHSQVHLTLWRAGDPIEGADLIILPGSKSVPDDLEFLRGHGWPQALARHLRYGGKLMGICGGFQMLGTRLADPLGVEGHPKSVDGLGFLAVETCYGAEKILAQVTGHLLDSHAPLIGYEIHMGTTTGSDLARPLAILAEGVPHGAISTDGQVMGGYIHGLFDHPEALKAILAWAGLNTLETIDMAKETEKSIDRLTDHVAAHINMTLLDQLLSGDRCSF